MTTFTPWKAAKNTLFYPFFHPASLKYAQKTMLTLWQNLSLKKTLKITLCTLNTWNKARKTITTLRQHYNFEIWRKTPYSYTFFTLLTWNTAIKTMLTLWQHLHPEIWPETPYSATFFILQTWNTARKTMLTLWQHSLKNYRTLLPHCEKTI